MKILLAICFLVPFIYFGYLMSRLDKFLANNAVSIGKADKSPRAIVLGRTDLARRMTNLLENKGIKVINLEDPFQLVQEQKLCCLFALSERDADNIAFCKIGKKLYGIEDMISICNDKRNENMFKSENISYLLNENAAVGELFQHMQQNLEVKLENGHK